jgi:uncharacterized membrane protein YccF (DUF307 family)
LDQRPAIPSSAPVDVTINPFRQGPGYIIRVIWFIFIGWWLGGIVITTAYLLLPWVVTTPFSFWLFNRVGTAMTLRPRSTLWESVETQRGFELRQRQIPQVPWPVRAVYFVLFGWWVGALYLGFAYFLCLLIVTLPVGLLMIDRAPGIITLQRN